MTGPEQFARKIRTYMEESGMIPEPRPASTTDSGSESPAESRLKTGTGAGSDSELSPGHKKGNFSDNFPKNELWLNPGDPGQYCRGSSIIAGVSGGADSICLLRVLAELAPVMGFTLYAVHVHHGLRASADEDEVFVQKICEQLRVECTCFHVHAAEYAGDHGIGTEEAGRILRYDIFEKECRRREKQDGVLCRIAVAHHVEDQAETVIFHLCRGSTVTGMGGMRPVSGRIIRPLLQTSRKDIEDYLTQIGQGWRQDETNADERYTRNYIRRQILPALERINPNAAAHIGQLAADAAETDAYLAEVTEKALQQCAEGISGLRISALRTQPELIAQRVLFQYVARMAGQKKDIQAVHIEALLKLCSSSGNGQVSLPYGMTAHRNYDLLWIVSGSENHPQDQAYGMTSPPNRPSGITWPTSPSEYECTFFPFEGDLRSIPLKKYTKWFDYDRIGRLLVFRKRQSGDRITVTDRGDSKKVTRFMIDEKIPSAVRDRMILPAAGSEILWIPGYRMSAAFKVSKKTQNILQIRWTGIEEEEKDV